MDRNRPSLYYSNKERHSYKLKLVSSCYFLVEWMTQPGPNDPFWLSPMETVEQQKLNVVSTLSSSLVINIDLHFFVDCPAKVIISVFKV